MINRYLIDGQEAISLSVENSSVTVIKSLGGTVHSLILNKNEILFKDKPNMLSENELFRGRLLFPFNDRIPEGKYTFNNLDLQFPINCNGKDSIHGLIYNRNMEEISSSQDKNLETLTLSCKIDRTEYTGYPFSMELTVKYILTKDFFEMEFNVTNFGKEKAPFAIGWHPYFTFGKKIDSSQLTFGSNEYYDVDENLYYKGNKYSVQGTNLDFSKGQFIGNKELDVAISLSKEGEFSLVESNNRIDVSFSKDLFPVLQVFIPEDRFSIAVEPVSAPSDTFNYPDTGLKILDPGNNIQGFIKVELNNC